MERIYKSFYILWPYVVFNLQNMQKLYIQFSEFEVNDNCFSDIERELFKRANDVCQAAYAPYSNFYVGASLLLENELFVTGSNQENSSFPCGICAERVALFSAKSNYPNLKVFKIAITTQTKDFQNINPVAPCGLCRQVLLEYEIKQKHKIEIYIFNKKKVIKFNQAKDLLPFYFTEDRLKRRNC